MSVVHRGRLLLIAGPSGVGKKTLIDQIINDIDLKIALSVSWTTRQKREGEVHGVDYTFVTKEEFLSAIERGAMLEYAHFFENYYGTSKEWVESRLEQGINVLLEIETEGFHQIQAKFPELLSIFILPPSLHELERRLRNRGTEDDASVDMRLRKAEKEISESHYFNYQVVNDDLDRAVKELKSILRHELR